MKEEWSLITIDLILPIRERITHLSRTSRPQDCSILAVIAARWRETLPLAAYTRMICITTIFLLFWIRTTSSWKTEIKTSFSKPDLTTALLVIAPPEKWVAHKLCTHSPSSVYRCRDRCQNICDDMGGLWDLKSQTCSMVVYVDHICYRLVKNGTKWQLDTSKFVSLSTPHF